MIAYIVLAALQTAAAPAATTVPAATTLAPAAVATAKANPDDKIICQHEDTTGTRLGGHKVCMTKAQWREAAVQQRDAVKHAQDDRGYSHN